MTLRRALNRTLWRLQSATTCHFPISTADPMTAKPSMIYICFCAYTVVRGRRRIRKRTINGLFMGLEYRRPSVGYTDFTWRDSLYTNRPHVQYIIYKPCMWDLFLRRRARKVHVFFSTGPGFSINSSLNAVGLTRRKKPI